MRVSRISVKQLFYTFDHTIDLNLGERITLVHGLNGLGKTTLLRMVRNLCDSSYFELGAIPFKEFRLDFDDNSSVIVSHISGGDKNSKNKQRLRLQHLVDGSSTEDFEPPWPPEPSSLANTLDWIERYVPMVSRISANKWVHQPSGELLTLEQIVERFGEFLPADLLAHKSLPPWLSKLKKTVHIRLIETQRLLTPGRATRRPHPEAESAITPAITMHSDELANRIGRQEKEYGRLAQTLDRTFPIRYVQQKQKISLSEEALRSKFQEIETKRARLEEAGLLGKEVAGFEMPQQMDEADRGVLSVYVHDIDQKLSVFDDLAARIDLFKSIVNNHFQYKKILIHKEKGFRFRSTRTNAELDASDLSSGEQHEVVVLYELLFHLKANSLVLIDEPEISLHIAWQEEFLSDLQRIIRLSPFDAVIATHSPQIVNDRWDLTVELTGPEEMEND